MGQKLEEQFELEYALYYREMEELLSFFKEHKDCRIFAYGNGGLYEKVKIELDKEKIVFDDVLVTKGDGIYSSITHQKYTKDVADIILICSSYYDEIVPFLLKVGIHKEQIRIAFSSRKSDKAKMRFFQGVQSKQRELLRQIKDKKKIKIVFLTIHKSIWKLDTVFQKMLADPFFEPIILVCPYTLYGEKRMWQDMKECCEYFEEKGYPLISSYNKAEQRWVALEEINPDIVFITNPYNLTRNDYYITAYENYLSCYVPYYFMATKHAGDEMVQYNNLVFLNAWKVYWPHEYCGELHQRLSSNKGVNGLTLGYPAVERLHVGKISVSSECVWKKQRGNLKKIIFAPHHTIENTTRSLSSFLFFSELLQTLAIRYQNEVQWSFKPHPILKTKLYLHPSWGKEKTDRYYEFWEEQEYTQLNEGEYDALFLNSDAIIHDCSSFIVEYAFTRKPCLYLVNQNDINDLLNEFGKGVMEVYEKAKTSQEIEDFIKKVITDTINIEVGKYTYFNKYIDKYYQGKLPSERIINDLKLSLGVLGEQ